MPVAMPWCLPKKKAQSYGRRFERLSNKQDAVHSTSCWGHCEIEGVEAEHQPTVVSSLTRRVVQSKLPACVHVLVAGHRNDDAADWAAECRSLQQSSRNAASVSWLLE